MAKKRDPWIELGLGKLDRSPHVLHCLMCRELLKFCSVAEEDDYLVRARDVIVAHEKKVPVPEGTGCRHSGCVFHEVISRTLALRMIKLGGGNKPGRDMRGVLWSSIPLIVREEDHPEGFDMTKQDIVHRYFKYLPPCAGDVYIRLGSKKATAHVRVSPAYKSRHEDIHDVPNIEDVVETSEKTVPAIMTWCMAKYRTLKELAATQ